MTSTTTPVNEASRLTTLRALDILDSPAEERFDRLTRMATRLFGVPIALISLVDKDRLWFKSRQGLQDGQMRRSQSFCDRAILGLEVMVVADALLDKRFSQSPQVLEGPEVRFYAGCPLIAANGSRLGTLCLMAGQPREMSESDLALLRDLAQLVQRELALAQITTIDELTGLPNRGGFLAVARHTLGLCVRRMERPASLLYFDLDQFKPNNESLGDAEGDKALKIFATLLTKTFRDCDVLGRIAGDQFVVLATDCGRIQTERAVERLQRNLDKAKRKDQLEYAIQFSVGVVAFEPIRHRSIEALVADGEALMLESKRQKRAA